MCMIFTESKAYYYREGGKSVPIKEHVAKEFLEFRGWYVWLETPAICIIAK